MAKRPKKQRGYKMIAFKAYVDNDAEILEWWENIEEGERSETLRDLIRVSLGLSPKAQRKRQLESPELSELKRDTVWIKDALKDMPNYIEALIQELADYLATQPKQSVPIEPVRQAEDTLSQSDTERRAGRMKRATW